MNAYSFSFASIILATITGLVYAASLGFVSAMVTLAVLVTILLISLGAGITLTATNLMAKQAQKAFTDNAQENLSIMQSLQSVQNQQNAALMQQLNQVARLPQPTAPVDLTKSLLIEDGIFAELDN